MEVPNVSRQEFQLLDIDDGYLSLMTADGDTKMMSKSQKVNWVTSYNRIR